MIMSSSCFVPPVRPGKPYSADEIILYGLDLTLVAKIRARADGDDWNIYSYTWGQQEDDEEPHVSQEGGEEPEFHLEGFFKLLRQTLERAKPVRRQFAAIYGYAYEGSCYRLDKPKILVFKPQGKKKKTVPAVGCGFDGKDLNYSMWRVRASDTLVEMTINADTFQALILEQNLPGKRAPNTYAATMISGGMAHRGGRLVES
jgi:hypothetical protein